jgi:hypothetical protein
VVGRILGAREQVGSLETLAALLERHQRALWERWGSGSAWYFKSSRSRAV